MNFDVLMYCHIAPILITLSLIGNSLGYLAAHRNNKYKKVAQTILLRAIFAFNLLSSMASIAWPIMSCWGSQTCAKWWMSLAWSRFISKFQAPILKSSICTSFLLSFLICLDRFIAVWRPFRHTVICSSRNAKVSICIACVIAFAFYTPTTMWFRINPINANATEILNSSEVERFGVICSQSMRYSHLVSRGDTYLRGSWVWITYQIVRELVTSFLPILLMVIMNIKIMKDLKKIRHFCTTVDTNASITTRPYNNDPSQYSLKDTLHDKIRLSVFGNKLNKAKVETCIPPRTEFNNVNSANTRPKRVTTIFLSRSTNLGYGNHFRNSRILENDRRNRIMLITLILQFLVFLLPVSALQMFYDLMYGKVNKPTFDKVKVIATINEIQYFTWCFYLNVIFNTRYRDQMSEMLRAMYYKIGSYVLAPVRLFKIPFISKSR